MSHATLVVKVTAKRLAAHKGDLDAAIAEMMAPYNEQTEDRRYQVFEDEEDEHRKDYETGTRTMVQTPKGELLSTWDDRFRVPGAFGIGSGTHKTPDDCKEIEVPFRELYADFETFAEQYCGSRRDPTIGRHGHWHNPNAKWDWYKIGGRWRGFFPVRPGVNPIIGEAGAFDNEATPGGGDVVRLADIDMDLVAQKTREAAESFWADWQSWLAGTYVERDPFSGPRRRALDIGLLRVEQGPALSDHTQKAIPWVDQVKKDDPRASWHDVAKLVDHDKFMAEYIDCFCPIKSFAALNNDGWHEPGEMGWFGCSSDTPETYVPFARDFVRRFIKTAAPDDLLVAVDYHI